MFNQNFYPTPESLLEELFNLELKDSKFPSMHVPSGRILEPSAGKGNIIEFINKNQDYYGRKELTIEAIEKDLNLKNLLFGAGHNVVWDDFLTYETHKEYDAIVMNPPFDEGARHVLKAIELAEKQIAKTCSIYAIINAETINNPFSIERQMLLNMLDKYKAKIEFKQDAFSGSDSERKTNVEVALITFKVAVKAQAEDIYDRYINAATKNKKTDTAVLERSLSIDYTNNEIQERLNNIERYVSEYEAAVKVIKSAYKASIEESKLLDYLTTVNKETYKLNSLNSSSDFESEENYLNKLDSLRAAYWELILNTKEIRSLLTTGGREKLQKKLSLSSNLEINLVNIEMLIMSLKMNEKDILVDGCVSLFERITKYHMNDFSKNIHYYNGWKTNNAFKMNSKVIYPLYEMFFRVGRNDSNYSYDDITYSVKDIISDVIRMMKLFNPSVKEEFSAVGANHFENEWLRFKVFKKGTVHIWFKDQELLNKFNFICGQHFNWLPTDEEMESKEAQEFVEKEFGIIEDPSNLLTA